MTSARNIRMVSAALVACIFTACNEESHVSFRTWDTNDDQVITRGESMEKWDDIGYYKDRDVNDDNVLDQEEWQTTFDEYYYDWDNDQLSVYNEWDQDDDGKLTQEELADGTFAYWDANGDGQVSKQEYKERAGSEYR